MSQGAAFGNRWWIVFGATLSMLVAQGPVILYTLGLFIKPLNQEFGWDRASISAAGGIAAIFSAITIPVRGITDGSLGRPDRSASDRCPLRLKRRTHCPDPKISHRVHAVLCDHRRFGIGPGASRLCKMRLCLV